MAASWPTSVATDSNLYVGVNELQNNLSAGINNAVTTVGINSTTGFPAVGLVLIDNEVIKYAGISGNNLTGCTRGFDGTTAASHSSSAIVSFAICADHHNVLKNEIEAIETYLSNNLGLNAQPLATGSRALASSAGGKISESSVTSTELGYLSGVTSAIQTQLNGKQASGTYVANPMTGDLAAGSNKITGLANGSAASDAAAFGQIPVFTDWASYTPTFVGLGTVSGVSCFWRQEGKSIHVRGYCVTGTVTGSAVTITLPNSTTIATSHVPAGLTSVLGVAFDCYNNAGGAVISATKSSGIMAIFSDGSDTSHVYLAGKVNSSVFTKSIGTDMFLNTDGFAFDFNYPI